MSLIIFICVVYVRTDCKIVLSMQGQIVRIGYCLKSQSLSNKVLSSEFSLSLSHTHTHTHTLFLSLDCRSQHICAYRDLFVFYNVTDKCNTVSGSFQDKYFFAKWDNGSREDLSKAAGPHLPSKIQFVPVFRMFGIWAFPVSACHSYWDEGFGRLQQAQPISGPSRRNNNKNKHTQQKTKTKKTR